VCGWHADGTRAWTTELPATHPELAIDLEVAPSAVFAYVRGSRTAWTLDPQTGAIAARHDVPSELGVWVCNMRMAPDGTRVIARIGTEAQLFALPGFTQVAKLENYCNEESIAFSHDGTHAAVNGHEVHLYDLAGPTCIATFEPDDTPYHTCFTPAGRLVTADGSCGVRIFERDGTAVAAFDAMPERKKKQALRQLAVTDTRIAVVRDDGEVIVFDHERELKRLGKLAPWAIAFSADGTQLWVATVGIAMYSV
nr:hypothetical protein [Deltaproteobacteria bacterium]